MELSIFARFHAREGQAAAMAEALREVVGPTRAEAGCLAIEAHCALREPDLFFIHSRWVDETAFEAHAELAHTVDFLARVAPLIDHPLEIVRTRPLEAADTTRG